MCKAHRWLYQSTLGSRVIKKKEEEGVYFAPCRRGSGVGLDACGAAPCRDDARRVYLDWFVLHVILKALLATSECK